MRADGQVLTACGVCAQASTGLKYSLTQALTFLLPKKVRNSKQLNLIKKQKSVQFSYSSGMGFTVCLCLAGRSCVGHLSLCTLTGLGAVQLLQYKYGSNKQRVFTVGQREFNMTSPGT